MVPDFAHYPYKDHRETVIGETQKGEEADLAPCTFPAPGTHWLFTSTSYFGVFWFTDEELDETEEMDDKGCLMTCSGLPERISGTKLCRLITDRGSEVVQASKASLLSSHRVLAHVAALVKSEHRDVRTNVVQHSPLLHQYRDQDH